MVRQALFNRELAVRAVSGAILAMAALATAWAGGAIFVAFWTAAGAIIAWEWQRLILPSPQARVIAAWAGVAASVAAVLISPWWLLLVPAAALGAALLPGRGRGWAAGGVPYAAALVAGVLLIRGPDGWDGLVAMTVIFLVVWGTDVGAYVAGRTLGGPRLWPSVSPNKTWSGAVGGLVTGLMAGACCLLLAGMPLAWSHAVLGCLLSLATQGGDLFESALKRRFAVKDTGHLIPGHGGLMDRLDGFIVAIILAASLGLLLGGWSNAAAALLRW